MKKNSNRLVKIVAIITGIVCFVSALTIFAAPISNLFTGNAETTVFNETAVATASIVNEDEIQVVESGTYFVGVTSTKLGDYTGATETYAPGEELPATVKEGDVYVYGDYEYRYMLRQVEVYANEVFERWDPVGNDTSFWTVRVLDTNKSSYGEILSEINGEPVTDLHRTFAYCRALTTAPTIPDSITRMIGTFKGCTKLTTAPTIPDSVISLENTFAGCTKLTTAPTISENVTILSNTFKGCTSLTGNIKINANPTCYRDCFYGTTKDIILVGSASDETKTALAETADGNVDY